MTTPRPSRNISRRRFVQGIGAAGAWCALSATPAWAAAERAGSLRVGVLVPLSMSSSNATRFHRGLQAGFDVATRATRVAFVPVVRPYRVGLLTAAGAASALFAQTGVKTIVALADGAVADELGRVAEAVGKRVVLAEAGANVVASGAGPRVVSSSLGYWEAAYALGAWAGRNAGRRAFVCASCMESGYDSLYAFSAGFEASGGKVVGTAVSHVQPGDNELPAALAALDDASPDVVYAAYGGRAAVDFVRAYASTSMARQAVLVASPFAIDDALLPQLGTAALGVRSCLSWAPDLATPGNAAFTTAYRRITRSAPDAVAALGFDTAMRVARDASRIAPSALPLTSGDVGRGAPLYLREVKRYGARPRNVAVARIANVRQVDTHADGVRPDLRSGWLEPHMGA